MLVFENAMLLVVRATTVLLVRTVGVTVDDEKASELVDAEIRVVTDDVLVAVISGADVTLVICVYMRVLMTAVGTRASDDLLM